MSIRNKALHWYEAKYGRLDRPIYTSKFYNKDESWPNRAVWWPQIPVKEIDTNKSQYIHILCQVAPNKNDFHHFKVPTKFLYDNLKKFHTLKGKIISLYLSTDPMRLFIEERGEGALNFGIFIVK